MLIEAEKSLTMGDKYTLHSITSMCYFLEKIMQYKSLYDESSGDSSIDGKLSALESYFRDSSSLAVKWSNIADIVVYSGLNTGVKFSVYLEYFVLPIEQRPKTPPPYYDLLMKQISQFLDKVDKEHDVGTSNMTSSSGSE